MNYTPLTRCEINEMTNSTKDCRKKMLIELLMRVRLSEALDVRAKDVNVWNHTIRIKGRYVLVSKGFIESFKQFMRDDKFIVFLDNAFLFYSNSNPQKPMHYKDAGQMIKGLAAKAGISKKVYCHAFRQAVET